MYMYVIDYIHIHSWRVQYYIYILAKFLSTRDGEYASLLLNTMDIKVNYSTTCIHVLNKFKHQNK